jgi:hypothetical protein
MGTATVSRLGYNRVFGGPLQGLCANSYVLKPSKKTGSSIERFASKISAKIQPSAPLSVFQPEKSRITPHDQRLTYTDDQNPPFIRPVFAIKLFNPEYQAERAHSPSGI